jgi:hypothetical protein
MAWATEDSNIFFRNFFSSMIFGSKIMIEASPFNMLCKKDLISQRSLCWWHEKNTIFWTKMPVQLNLTHYPPRVRSRTADSGMFENSQKIEDVSKCNDSWLDFSQYPPTHPKEQIRWLSAVGQWHKSHKHRQCIERVEYTLHLSKKGTK